MPAYKVPIPRVSCVNCGRVATCIVRNEVNEEIGPRCDRCGDVLVSQMNTQAAMRPKLTGERMQRELGPD